MTGFRDWLRRNRAARVGLLVITFVLPLTNIFSAAIVVMTARGGGWRIALPEVLAALAIIAVLVQLTNGSAFTAALGAAGLWGGALLAGSLLGRFRSVDLAMQSLVVAVLVGVLVAGFVLPDPRAYWQPVLEDLIRSAGLPQATGLPAGWLDIVAALMHGVIGASLLCTLFLALLLGVWLDPAEEGVDWRRRFRDLRLGRVLSVCAVLALVLQQLGGGATAGSLLLVLGTGLVAQGMAVVHWTADRRHWPKIWPLGLYGPLLLGPPPAGLMLLALALAGLADNVMGLRRARTDVV